MGLSWKEEERESGKRQKRHRMSLLGCKASGLGSFIGTERGSKMLEDAQHSKKIPCTLKGMERREGF